jgi:hypothetical protein
MRVAPDSCLPGPDAEVTWRAFIIGLMAVIGIALLDPYMSFNKGYGWNTQTHFPAGAAFVLVVLAAGLNAAIRLVRRRWALRRPEVMLVWCMLIVGCAVPSNLMRFWFPVLASPAYLARRADIVWKDTSLAAAPDGLLLTKDPRSVAARQFLEGWRGGEGRIPWNRWLPPIARWSAFLAAFYLATFCMCGMVRKQWVERERLQFPLAQVPLDFTAEGGPGRLLPAICYDRAFILGVVTIACLRLVRTAPIILGGDAAWNLNVPFADVLQQTPLQNLFLENYSMNWMPIGLAYLVPADVSLSIWFFYLFGRLELITSYWMGSTVHYSGTYSELMLWQRPGAYLAFTIGALYMARRHLADVVRTAFRRSGAVDDSAEPVGYSFAFWGFLAGCAGMVAWFLIYGMGPAGALAMIGLLLCIQLVHARVVSQSGLYRTSPLAQGPNLLNALSFGHLFASTGATVAHMQYRIMINGNNSMLGPAAVHCFRIADVFERRRRWLLPAMGAALIAAIAAASWTCLYQAYSDSALNFSNVWAAIDNPRDAFELAHQMITRPDQGTVVRWVPLGLGLGLTGAVMALRARFYWWPVHPVGLLAFASFGLDRMWLSFLLGWLIKVSVLKFGSGGLLRAGRRYFVGFILAEFFLNGAWSLVSLLTGGAVPGAGVWI